jgi:MazG family protein
MDPDEPAKAFRELVAVIKALRTPGTGCPWDLEQNHHTLRPYLLEETYEVLEAIDRQDDTAFQEELGDLLLQIVLHAQIAADRRAFAINNVVDSITAKMVRRHPHVFGDTRVSGTEDVRRNWEQIKAAEKQASGEKARESSTSPALLRAQRRARAAHQQATFAEVREKLEALEGEAAASVPDQRPHLENALAELLFVLCQLARRLGINAEDSLRAWLK